MHSSPRYAEGPEAPPRRLTVHSLLVFTATVVAVLLSAAALLDLLGWASF